MLKDIKTFHCTLTQLFDMFYKVYADNPDEKKGIHRLLKIKEESNEKIDIDSLLSSCKPPIFWKEKPIIRKQLNIWKVKDLKKIISDINNTELLCKKNPNVSNSIFFSFFLEICKKANSFS